MIQFYRSSPNEINGSVAALTSIYTTDWSNCWHQVTFVLKSRGEAVTFFQDFTSWKKNPLAPVISFLLKNKCLIRQCTAGKLKWKKIQPKFVNLKNRQSRFSLCANPVYAQCVHIRVQMRFQSTVDAACPVFMHSCVTFSCPAGAIGFSVTYILLTFSCWDCIEVMLLLPPGVTSGDTGFRIAIYRNADVLGRTGISNRAESLPLPLTEVVPHGPWAISVWWAL